MRTIKQFEDGARKVEINGVELIARKDGAVSWMSDWCRGLELEAAGVLRTVHYGPGTYGHSSYFLA